MPLVVLIASCGGPSPTDAGLDAGADAAVEGMSSVRFAHFSWDAPAVSVWVDGVLVVDGIETLSRAPGYLSVPSGARDIAYAPVGEGPEAALFRDTLELAPGTPYTVFSFGTLDPLDGSAAHTGLGLSDDTPPAAGLMRGRFVHAATGVGALDVRVDTPLAGDMNGEALGVAPGTASSRLLDGTPDPGSRTSITIELGPAGVAEPTTGRAISETFGPYTLVALVGDALAPMQYALAMLTDDRILQLPLYADVCVAHAASGAAVGFRACRAPGDCTGPITVEPRHVECLPGGASVEVTRDGTLATAQTGAAHFVRAPLFVLYDHGGSPALAYFTLPAEAVPTDALGLRMSHLADGFGPLDLSEAPHGTPLATALAFGASTDRVEVPDGDGAVVAADADGDGAPEQRLPLRADPSSELDVLAYAEGGALHLARIRSGVAGTMLVAGALPVGGDCAAAACAPEALCVTAAVEAAPTCRAADCAASSCGVDEACGAVRTDQATESWDAGSPVCMPRVEVSGDVEATLDGDGTGSFELSVGGETYTLDHVRAETWRLLRLRGVRVLALDAARAAGGTGWSAVVSFTSLPASGPAGVRVGYGEGPDPMYDEEVFATEADVEVRVAPAVVEAGEPISLTFAASGPSQGTLYPGAY